MLEIETRAEASFTQRVQLDGAAYVLRIRWNDRASVYVLDVLDGAEDPLLLGVALRVRRPLNDPASGRGPPGLLVLDAPADPSFADLGTAARLYYLTAAEYQGLGS